MWRSKARAAARWVYPAVAALDSVAVVAQARGMRIVTKPAVLAALAASRPSRDHAMTAGLVASWWGDVALLGRSERSFRVGLGSFLVAHLAYIAGLSRQARLDTLGAVVPVMAAATGGAVLFGRWAGPLRVPVTVYALPLGAMVAAATTVRGPGARRVVGGAALFAVSDGLLGAGKFALNGRAARIASAGVMPTYAAAQWLIHTGAARTDRSG